jgi:F0F1-type ATP synthase membrane subunit a
MVTAILIPIVCIYFYWLTKKEMKEHDKEWLASGEIKHEAVLKGVIKSIYAEKQRFYYNRYLYIHTLVIQADAKSITVKKIVPLTKDLKPDNFTVGDIITVFGRWEANTFLFNHYETKKME